MQTVNDYLSKILKTTGFGYWNGTWGQTATDQLWNENKARLPSWYNAHPDAKARWMGKRVVDCCGLDKYARWVQSDGNVKYDSSTDLNETMLFNLAKTDGRKWGTIDTMPDVPGLVVCKTGHMGIYIGNGVERESRGGDYGVQDYMLKDRPFTHWFENPFIDYINNGGEGMDVLFKGCPVSEAVGAWQRSILKCGYKMINSKGEECSVDNDFGGGTENGTKLFQADEGLPQTGKVDEFTYGKMLDRIIKNNEKDSAELCQNFMDKSNELIAANEKINAFITENAMLEAQIADLEFSVSEVTKDKAALSEDKTKLMKEIDDLNYRIVTEKTIAEKKYNDLLEKYGNQPPATSDLSAYSVGVLIAECIKRIADAFKKKT